MMTNVASKTPYGGLYFKMSEVTVEQMALFYEKCSSLTAIGTHKDEQECQWLKDFVQKEYRGRGYFGIMPSPDGSPYIIGYSYSKASFEKEADKDVERGHKKIKDWL